MQQLSVILARVIAQLIRQIFQHATRRTAHHIARQTAHHIARQTAHHIARQTAQQAANPIAQLNAKTAQMRSDNARNQAFLRNWKPLQAPQGPAWNTPNQPDDFDMFG